MPLEIIRGDEQAPLSGLADRTVAIIGYGNQGRAHGLNLRETAAATPEVPFQVIIGSRTDRPSGKAARNDGFEAMPIAEAVARANLVVIGLPDEVHRSVYENEIGPSLKPGATIGFLHGFSIHFGLVRPAPDIGVTLLAPKGPGAAVRDRFLKGQGLPCLMAIHQDTKQADAEALTLGWANGIGAARAGIIRTTFAQEAETDLFGEQSVLCGGMLALIRAAIDTLIDAGYPRELAYIECCHELKQIADLVYERGLSEMGAAISTTAEFGMHHAAGLLDDDHLRRIMTRLLDDVRSGRFADLMQDDAARGSTWLNEQRRLLRDHPNEPAGAVVRSLMPWLGSDSGSIPPLES